MAKRSIDERNSRWVKVEDAPETVQLRLMKNVTLKIRGSVTGNEYIFRGAGSVLNVDARDVPEFLSRVRPDSCCGGTKGAPIFSLA